MRSVMGPDAGASCEIKQPEDVGIERTWSEQSRGLLSGGATRGIGGFRRHVRAFIAKRPIVAVGHPACIQADHFASITNQIDTVAFEGDGRTDPHLRPIEISVFLTLRND